MRAKTYIDRGYVRVIFRMFQGEVIALFPDLPGDTNPAHCTCFVHIGQHSAANITHVINHSRPCTYDERRPLLNELTSAPYNYKLVERTRYVRLHSPKGQQ